MNNYHILFLYILFLVFSSCASDYVESGPIEFEMAEHIYEHPDCVTDQGPCVSLHFIYPEFAGDEKLIQSLRRWTQKQIYQPGDSTTPEPNLEELSNEWFNDYNQYSREIQGYNISWSLERRVEVVLDTRNIISLHFNEYSFTGGAHPVQIDIFRSFEKPDGAILTLNDLTYDDAQLEQLKVMAEEQFRFSYELLEDDNLEDAGFHFLDGEFYLTENFAFTDFGLLFYYNVYEVAPYATGPIAVELSYDDLENILRSSWLKQQDQLTMR